MKRNILLIIFVGLSLTGLAQDATIAMHRIRLSDLTFTNGRSVVDANPLFISNFKKMNLNSALLDKYNWSFNRLIPDKVYAARMYDLSASFQFSNKKKNKYSETRQLRLGVKYYSSRTFFAGSYNEVAMPYDFWQPADSNMYVALDSVFDYALKAYYSCDQLLFNGSFLFSTPQYYRVSVFAGIGFVAGSSVQSNAEINYEEYVSTQVRFPQNSGYSTQSLNDNFRYTTESEQMHAPSLFTSGFYIPIGLDIRLGAKDNFLKHVHLHIETSVGNEWNKLAAIESLRGYWVTGMAGIKYKL